MNEIALKYKGNVTIKVKVGDKVFELSSHNEVGEYLNRCFCYAISGNYREERDSVQFLDVLLSENNTSMLANVIPITAKTVSYIPKASDNLTLVYKAQFTAVITYSNLVSSIENKDYNLVLYAEYNASNLSNTYLAKFGVPGSKLKNISPSVNGIIEWTMFIDVENSNQN